MNLNNLTPGIQSIGKSTIATKRYIRRSSLIIIILAFTALTVTWTFFILNKPQYIVPVVTHTELKKINQKFQYASSSPTSMVSTITPLQIVSINDSPDAVPTDSISPNSLITIYWSAPENSNLTLTGDQFGDGFWISNGKDSAYLDDVNNYLVSTAQGEDAAEIYFPNALCPGAENISCSLSSEVPFSSGKYFFYIKSDEGKARSKNHDILIDTNDSNATYGSITYMVLNSISGCGNAGMIDNEDYGYCDGALGQLDNVTKKYSVLIPDLWQVVPGLSSNEEVALLFAEQGSVFFNANAISGGEEFIYANGYYRYDIGSGQLTKLSYQVGNCPVISNDNSYIADDYTASSTVEVKVFSLEADKYIYSTDLLPTESLNNGQDGMSCDDGFTWNNNDELSYTIYDASQNLSQDQLDNGNGYPPLKLKTLNFSPLSQ
jgi:hypothetical protein